MWRTFLRAAIRVITAIAISCISQSKVFRKPVPRWAHSGAGGHTANGNAPVKECHTASPIEAPPITHSGSRILCDCDAFAINNERQGACQSRLCDKPGVAREVGAAPEKLGDLRCAGRSAGYISAQNMGMAGSSPDRPYGRVSRRSGRQYSADHHAFGLRRIDRQVAACPASQNTGEIALHIARCQIAHGNVGIQGRRGFLA